MIQTHLWAEKTNFQSCLVERNESSRLEMPASRRKNEEYDENSDDGKKVRELSCEQRTMPGGTGSVNLLMSDTLQRDGL